MRIRPAKEEDLPNIHKMGHSAWGEGAPVDAYIQQCLSSQKYKKGQWFVLEDETGATLSSLICYKNAFGLEDGCAGIGSIATLPDQRHKGYASRLIKDIIAQFIGEKIKHIFLYSDINVAFYKKMGFQTLDKKQQKHLPSVCMMLNVMQDTESLAIPSYF